MNRTKHKAINPLTNSIFDMDFKGRFGQNLKGLDEVILIPSGAEWVNRIAIAGDLERIARNIRKNMNRKI